MDQKLLLLINREWTGPVLDRAMAICSSLDFWMPLLILAGAAVAVWGGFRGRVFLLVLGCCLGFSDGLLGNTLKHWVNRPRPAQVLGGVRQVDLAKAHPRLLAVTRPLTVRLARVGSGGPPGRSFPSSHTTNIVSMALAAACFFPRRGWLALPVALLVAYSRIYTGAHWPSDVAASLFLGMGIGLFTIVAAELLWRRAAARWWPEGFQRHPTLLS